MSRVCQTGTYDTPEWLSCGSIALLGQLLQVDPKRRVTVDELRCHPWVVDEIGVPVEWKSKYQARRNV